MRWPGAESAPALWVDNPGKNGIMTLQARKRLLGWALGPNEPP